MPKQKFTFTLNIFNICINFPDEPRVNNGSKFSENMTFRNNQEKNYNCEPEEHEGQKNRKGKFQEVSEKLVFYQLCDRNFANSLDFLCDYIEDRYYKAAKDKKGQRKGEKLIKLAESFKTNCLWAINDIDP